MPSQELSETEQRIGFNLAGLPEEKWLLRVIVGLGLWGLMYLPAYLFLSSLSLYSYFIQYQPDLLGIELDQIYTTCVLPMNLGWLLGGYLMSWPSKQAVDPVLRRWAMVFRISVMFLPLLILGRTGVGIYSNAVGSIDLVHIAIGEDLKFLDPALQTLMGIWLLVVFGIYMLFLARRINRQRWGVFIAAGLWMHAAYPLCWELFELTASNSGYGWGSSSFDYQFALVWALTILFPGAGLLVMFIKLIRLWKLRPEMIEQLQLDRIHEMEAEVMAESEEASQQEPWVYSLSKERWHDEVSRILKDQELKDCQHQWRFFITSVNGLIWILGLIFLGYPTALLTEMWLSRQSELPILAGDFAVLMICLGCILQGVFGAYFVSTSRREDAGQGYRIKVTYLSYALFASALVLLGMLIPMVRELVFYEFYAAPSWEMRREDYVIMGAVALIQVLIALHLIGVFRRVGLKGLAIIQCCSWLILFVISPVIYFLSQERISALYNMLELDYSPWNIGGAFTLNRLLYDLSHQEVYNASLLMCLPVIGLLMLLFTARIRLSKLLKFTESQPVIISPAAQSDEGISIDPS